MKEMLVVQTTFAEKKDAVALCEAALQQRLIACAQIIDQVESLYWWKDVIEHNREVLLLMKTTGDKYAGLERFIRKNHPYETPEIVAIAAEKIESGYLRWVREETQSMD